MNSLAWRRILPPVLFTTLALLIMGPLLLPGYVLHYDLVFSPYFELPPIDWHTGAGISSAWPLLAFIKLVGLVIPMDIIEKIVLLGMLAGAGYAMYRTAPVQSWIARVTAGTLYIVNPFVYDRFMAGHWLFLLGYALTPMALITFLRLMTEPSRRTWLLATVSWGVIALLSSHHLIILGILYICLAAMFVRSWRALFYALAMPAGVFIISLWWLIPLSIAPGGVSTFTISHLYAFITRPDTHYGLLAQMLSLQGFWHNGWLQPSAAFGMWWPTLWLLSLLPAWAGLAILRRPHEPPARIVIALICASALALIIAAGPAPATYQLNTWLFEHVPGFAGLREPQKLLALLALAYTWTAALGLELLRQWSRRVQVAVAILSLLASATLCWPLWWGAHGQLKAVAYPASWYEFRRVLSHTPQTDRVLVLPWEPYLEGTFAGPLVANPAAGFFGSRIIQSDELNLPNVSSNGPARYPKITSLLSTQDPSNWAHTLNELNVKYVIVERSRDAFDCTFLIRSGVVQEIIQDNDLKIFMLTKVN